MFRAGPDANLSCCNQICSGAEQIGQHDVPNLNRSSCSDPADFVHRLQKQLARDRAICLHRDQRAIPTDDPHAGRQDTHWFDGLLLCVALPTWTPVAFDSNHPAVLNSHSQLTADWARNAQDPFLDHSMITST